MTYENIILQVDGEIAVLTVNRPKVLNALSHATVAELAAAFQEVEANPQVRALIITGAGPKSFVAGADIGELRVLTPAEGEQMCLRAKQLFRRMENSRLVVLMAVNGFALGGGCELAMAGDIRIASDNARLGQPEVKLGLIPGYGGTQRLPRLVGMGQAMRLVLSGEHIPALEARAIGLVDLVVCQKCGQEMPGSPCREGCGHEAHCPNCGQAVPTCPQCYGPLDRWGYCHACNPEAPSTALSAARDLAGRILKNGPLAVEAAKRCLRVGADAPLDQALAFEAAQFGLICATEDKFEGTSAFLEKREPRFQRR
ncbi:MAG: enoyl-CoA hydratase-related protein [Chloroflexia bacterium]